MKHVLRTSPALAAPTSIGFRISYELLTPVKTLRRELGLTPNDLAVLTALISFLPRDKSGRQQAVAPSITIVFPSNESLSERANGIDERTIRRCITRLENAGLVSRKASANGKRFPLRFGGVIKDAFGFDLLPLAKQFAALTVRAKALTDARRDLGSLKAQAMSLRVKAAKRTDLSEAEVAQLAIARNALRRATIGADQLSDMITALQALVDRKANKIRVLVDVTGDTEPVHQDSESHQTTAKNGQFVRHIESQKRDSLEDGNGKREDNTAIRSRKGFEHQRTEPILWNDYAQLASFFPDPPISADGFMRRLSDIGSMLRIRYESLMQALRHAGPEKVLRTLDYLLAKADSVQKPESYFAKVVFG